MSYDAMAELIGDKKGKLGVYLNGGSYNPGNQPQYEKEWEYFDVNVVKWGKKDECGESIISENFGNIIDAVHFYYKTRKQYLKRDFVHKTMTPTVTKKYTIEFTKIGAIIIAKKIYIARSEQWKNCSATGINKAEATSNLSD